ncbi:MAG: cytochrome c oxidase accessory protein CcoG [Rhodospirillaceae bacterium]|nr:cytochrome c oxidase accessory protein CcoG [Rhodospirillaceae bacterium]
MESPDAAASGALGDVVERSEVEPVNKKEWRSLYQKREKIHPKRAEGTFRRIKWIVMAVTLAIYYLAPWLRWDRGPDAPDQAILIDMPARKFYFFFIEIWPQEFYYVTGLLILAALSLFLITSVAGRVWCGYTCPQTVWTDLFIAVERMIEGDRNARIKLDRAPFSMSKLRKRAEKHAIWLLIALCTGGAWVFYFADAPTLAGELLRFDAPAIAYITIGILTGTTYLLGGFAREQVCTYMCPWPRIQSAMIDEDSLIVTYHADRGEPRGAHKKGESWEGRGHCVDCNQCVAVCPMGIDIRDGMQLECISCALCIDACDGVMDKVGLPRGLIAYDTITNMERRAEGKKPIGHILRPRTILYASLIAVIGSVMLYLLATRSDLELNVLRDRNPLFVTLSDGSIRNGYTVKILNMAHETRTFGLTVEGLENPTYTVVGAEDVSALTVGPDSVGSFRIFVAVPQGTIHHGSKDVEFVITDKATGDEVENETSFKGPRR